MKAHTRVLSLLTLALAPVLALAANYKGEPGPANYKGEAPAKFPTATQYLPDQDPVSADYAKTVYSSDLYGGTIQGPAYVPSTDWSLHDGFFLGVQGGYDSYKMRHSVNVNDGFFQFAESPELSAVGTAYTFLLGFGKYFDYPLYMGADFFYNFSRANAVDNVTYFDGANGAYSLKSEILGNYGLEITPGLKLSDNTLFFLKGGLVRLQIKTFETSEVLAVNNAQTNGENGFEFGGGFEVDLYRNLSLRGEYMHINGADVKTTVGTKISASDNQVMLGLVFHPF